ncbi:hypothetical protein AOLI_G00296170 [Acnodon oligacanthus]
MGMVVLVLVCPHALSVAFWEHSCLDTQAPYAGGSGAHHSISTGHQSPGHRITLQSKLRPTDFTRILVSSSSASCVAVKTPVAVESALYVVICFVICPLWSSDAVHVSRAWSSGLRINKTIRGGAAGVLRALHPGGRRYCRLDIKEHFVSLRSQGAPVCGTLGVAG